MNHPQMNLWVSFPETQESPSPPKGIPADEAEAAGMRLTGEPGLEPGENNMPGETILIPGRKRIYRASRVYSLVIPK